MNVQPEPLVADPEVEIAEELVPDSVEHELSNAMLGLEGTAPPVELRAARKGRAGLVIAVGWLAIVTLLALGADLLPVQDPNAISSELSQSPGFRIDEPLGTDNLGRSMLSRVIYGGRVSLAVSLGAVSVSLLIGLLLGLAGGYLRGAIDTILDVLITAMLSFPPLVFLIAVTTILEPSVWTLIVALGALGTPLMVRVVRANTISIADREYVAAARAMGMGRFRILVREVLPNVLPATLSFALVVVAALMVAEGSLSFLGLGVRPPTPSWGVMISNSIPQLRTHSYQMFVPALVFFFTVLSLNTVGNWARGRAEGRS